MKIFEKYSSIISELCIKYKVKSLFVFGSVLTDRFNSDSDIDFLVEFNKNEIADYFSNYFDLKNALEDLFKRNIDLVESQSLKNPYFINSVNSTKTLVYGN
ncbi:MAG: nucleotidyltransferase domain-containing protein [Paludibacteraceae bacterium]|nr:nucleotidyltransferase domain-containing protein [Paludibacteraceae bacterium]